MKYLASILTFLILSVSASAENASTTINSVTATNTAATTSTSSTSTNTPTTTLTIENAATSSLASTTASTTLLESCEIKAKLNLRKEKINTQIKKQLTDKNKLVTNLMAVASSTNEESKLLIQDSIIKLEGEVLGLIRSQKEILNVIASTTETPCANTIKLKKENDKAQIKIKKINSDIEKRALIINSFIKNDIRSVVEKSEE